MVKKIVICFIVFFFISNIHLFSEEIIVPWKVVPGYLWITIYLSEQFVEDYSEFYDNLDINAKKKYDRIERILDNLCNRLLEAKVAFDQMGGTLPSCLKEKLTQYFNELKTGTKKLDIYWDVKEEKDFVLLPRQLHGSGLSPSSGEEIDIWDAYKEKFEELIFNNGSKQVLTSSLFLHELIHTVKKAYKYKCFQKLPRWKEEFSTDWGCVKIFGDNSTTFYLDSHPQGWEKDYCTYKIVCKCENGCPKESGEPCSPQPPTGGDGVGSGGADPGGDYPDDNYSSSSGIIREYDLAPEAVILANGYWQEALKLYGGLKAEPEFTAQVLIGSSPFLVIPTGGLFGKKNDSTLRNVLAEYVRLGGTLIVFSQQWGRDFEILPKPEEASLKSYGWREDQGCVYGAMGMENIHPVLTGQTRFHPSVICGEPLLHNTDAKDTSRKPEFLGKYFQIRLLCKIKQDSLSKPGIIYAEDILAKNRLKEKI